MPETVSGFPGFELVEDPNQVHPQASDRGKFRDSATYATEWIRAGSREASVRCDLPERHHLDCRPTISGLTIPGLIHGDPEGGMNERYDGERASTDSDGGSDRNRRTANSLRAN